jgi:hypothetical protein
VKAAIDILERGVIYHLIFGLYLVTNKEIFSYEPTRALTAPLYSSWLGTKMADFLYISPERFTTPHGSLYAAVGSFIILFVVLDKVTAIVFGEGIISAGIMLFINVCSMQG